MPGPTRHVSRTHAVAVLAAGVVLVLSGCGGSDDGSDAVADGAATSAPAATATAPAPTTTAPVVREGSDAPRSGVVTRQEAEAAALAAVGSGQVTWSGPEDDRGAAWEVEITRPDGSEVDVLVAADGTVVKQVDKLGGQPAAPAGGGAQPSGGQVVSRAQAEQAALAAVGSGRVTWSGREDERGAAWEIEITRPDGSEVDVLIDASGQVVG